MAIYHVHFTCAADYMARRLPFRPAHLKQLAGLREDGRVVAGGPEPDGTAANIFYRVGGIDELERILEDKVQSREAFQKPPRAFAGSLPSSLRHSTPAPCISRSMPASRRRAFMPRALLRAGRAASSGLRDAPAWRLRSPTRLGDEGL